VVVTPDACIFRYPHDVPVQVCITGFSMPFPRIRLPAAMRIYSYVPASGRYTGFPKAVLWITSGRTDFPFGLKKDQM